MLVSNGPGTLSSTTSQCRFHERLLLDHWPRSRVQKLVEYDEASDADSTSKDGGVGWEAPKMVAFDGWLLGNGRMLAEETGSEHGRCVDLLVSFARTEPISGLRRPGKGIWQKAESDQREQLNLGVYESGLARCFGLEEEERGPGGFFPWLERQRGRSG
jgi:hypothetical protein